MIGRTISHYRVIAQLGSGGMGVVYEAEDTRLGRHVAVKVLSPEACGDPLAMERFLREARIVSSLSHPHICTLHDIGEIDGQQFMVMELLEGDTLKQRLARGALPLDDLLELGVQIADALDAAHSHNVIHRDIKPHNVVITRRLAKVLDFGVAKLTEGGRDRSNDLEQTKAATEVTTTGSAVGTIGYMSPEQARGQEIDTRSDLFSLGVVLYEMATGRQPFPGATPAVIFEGILTKTPPPPSELNASIPPELDRMVAKALEKDRETRYQSAAELRADLKRLKRETETGRTAVAAGTAAATGTPPVSAAAPPGTRLRRALFIGAPLVTAVAIGGIFLWQVQRTPALTERDAVVLADFTNRTGDTMFDGTLSEALGVQLRQSPFLNLLPEQQVAATLRLMGRDPMSAVTTDIAREVCQRTSAKATLGGSIASLGSSYVLTLRAQDCVNGSTLAEEQVQAASKEQVIGALGAAASNFRERLGESLASVQRYDSKIEEATTPSLEALKAYSQGMLTRRTQGDFDSQPFFRRAIELDPNFALAHARLGTVLSNLGERDEALKESTRAYELREKVSERERLYIEARYFTTVKNDVPRAIELHRLLIATYPGDFAAHSNLGSLLRNRGMVQEAIVNLEEAVRLAPDQPLGYVNLGYAYLDQSRFEEARKAFESTIKLTESGTARTGLFTIGVMTGDEALSAAQIAAVRGRREEIDMLNARVQAACYRGRVNEAAPLVDDLFRRLESMKRQHLAGEGWIGMAINYALLGRTDLARRELARARANGMLTDGTSDEVVVLGTVLGDAPLVQATLERALAHARRTAVAEDGDRGERGIKALAALAAGRNQEAYDVAISMGEDVRAREAIFIAAVAASRLRHWDDAVRLFEKLAALKSQLGLSPLYGTVQVMIGRAHAAAGRPAEAKKAYDEAFTIWKDADADLPILVAARKEYASL